MISVAKEGREACKCGVAAARRGGGARAAAHKGGDDGNTSERRNQEMSSARLPAKTQKEKETRENEELRKKIGAIFH